MTSGCAPSLWPTVPLDCPDTVCPRLDNPPKYRETLIFAACVSPDWNNIATDATIVSRAYYALAYLPTITLPCRYVWYGVPLLLQALVRRGFGGSPKRRPRSMCTLSPRAEALPASKTIVIGLSAMVRYGVPSYFLGRNLCNWHPKQGSGCSGHR
jgi:hypothetical protein